MYSRGYIIICNMAHQPCNCDRIGSIEVIQVPEDNSRLMSKKNGDCAFPPLLKLMIRMNNKNNVYYLFNNILS